MSFSSHSVFETLPARPPTPPREVPTEADDAVDFANDFLSSGNDIEHIATNGDTGKASGHAASHTTPTSSQERPASVTGSRRVDFSPNPRVHAVAPAGERSSPSSSSLKRSPSAKSAKPAKSILKQSLAPPPTPEDLENKLSYFSPDVPDSFAKMIQSVLQQLAGTSRSSRLDAYMTLNNTFRVYGNPPDLSPMVAKMPTLMQFLTRDMAWKGMDGKLDVQTISQALNVVFAIHNVRALSEALDDDFRTFLVDRSISVLEQKDMPKHMIKQHVGVIAAQRFKSSIMTTTRIERLITALQTIEDRCSGNSVVATRLMVYIRLTEQSPPVMLSRTSDWLPHVFHGVLSSFTEIRTRALEALVKTGNILGAQATATRAIESIFENDSDEGESYWTYFTMRLIEMLRDVETRACVPKIWSAIIMWFRSNRKPLGKWPKFQPWLAIMSQCFNSSDIKTRCEALQAWNKLVFVIASTSSVSDATLRTLRVPLTSGLAKKGPDHFSRYVRLHTLESYYLLLHYVLRPGLTFEKYDSAWDIAVPPVVTEIGNASPTWRDDICRILRGLVSPNDGAWNVNAALEPTAIKSDELPQLEPRWVRSRLAKILSVFEVVLNTGLSSSDAPFVRLRATWKLLMQCVAQAGTQEVRITSDLKEAIALLINMFCRTWKGCELPREDNVDAATWTDRYCSLVDIMLVEIGPRFFVEEILSKTSPDLVEVAPTPSHRSSKTYSMPLSPMIVLLDLFYHPPYPLKVGRSYLNSARNLLGRFLAAKASPLARMELLYRSLHAWTADDKAHDPEVPVTAMWTVSAEIATEILSSDASSGSGEQYQPQGQKLRAGLEILIAGLHTWTKAGSGGQMVDKLYSTLHGIAKTHAGDSGVVMAIMEPLAKATIEGRVGTALETKSMVTSLLLRDPVWPRSSQAMDQARKALWGVGIAPHKTALFDPFDSVYSLLRALLVDSYNAFDGSVPSSVALDEMSMQTIHFLRKAPLSLLGTALRKLQQIFVVWVEDKDHKTSDEQVAQVVLSTWSTVIELIGSLPIKDSNVLKALESLLVAGFSSPHRDVVNKTIVFWNDSFGQQASLEYPSKLGSVLRTRSEDAHIELPTFPETDDGPASLPQFYGFLSQTEPTRDESARKTFLTLHETTIPRRLGRPNRFDLSKSSPLRSAKDISSPGHKVQRSSASTTPRARLRHNDSQIEFAPIDSSPTRQDGESQMLTEHQKEVKTRQSHNAQLFPDFSSSPAAQSTALPKNVSKRLDFSAQVNMVDEGAHGTPTGLPDATNLQSDDIPSSPTPSSRAASQGPINVDDDLEHDDDLQDPPSSPPRADGDELSRDAPVADDADDAAVDVADFADLPNATLNKEDTDNDLEVDDNETDARPDDVILGSDLPSDSLLPDTQLLEEAAEAAQSTGLDTKDPEDKASQDPIQRPRTPPSDNDKPLEEHAIEAPPEEAADISRVEDSFIKVDVNPNDSQETEVSQSEASPNTGKKRKRSAGPVSKSKKRRKQSPIKTFWSTFIGGSQDDDEDIGEEIVVASQRSSAPDVSRVEQTVIAPEEPSVDVSQESVVHTKEESAVMQPPPKRGRGRPRKSQTPTPSLPDIQSSQSRKRRASVLSDISRESSHVSSSRVKETPAPGKAAKQRKQDTRQTTASQVSTRSESTTTRKAAGVVISRHEQALGRQSQESGEFDDTYSEEDSIGHATPEKQLAEEQAAAELSDHPILTPRSLLGRLWETLRDIKSLALGSQMEREFDDVLFELRRETHEAARRGREV